MADVVIECVDVFKLLDVYINRSLKWDDHVRTISNKAASRIYFLKQLKRSSVEPEDLFYFFLRFGHSRQFCSSQHVRLQCHPPVQVVDACIWQWQQRVWCAASNCRETTTYNAPLIIYLSLSLLARLVQLLRLLLDPSGHLAHFLTDYN